MADVTTMAEMWHDLMRIDPDVSRAIGSARRCVVCGRTWPLNRHHIVPRSAGELYEGGEKVEKPLIVLCGSGNTSGCHGKAHHLTLHFRNDRGRLEYREFAEPVNRLDALAAGGWWPVRVPGWEEL